MALLGPRDPFSVNVGAATPAATTGCESAGTGIQGNEEPSSAAPTPPRPATAKRPVHTFSAREIEGFRRCASLYHSDGDRRPKNWAATYVMHAEISPLLSTLEMPAKQARLYARDHGLIPGGSRIVYHPERWWPDRSSSCLTDVAPFSSEAALLGNAAAATGLHVTAVASGVGPGDPGSRAPSGVAPAMSQVTGVRTPTVLSGGGPSSGHAVPSHGPPVATADADSHSGRSSPSPDRNAGTSNSTPPSATHASVAPSSDAAAREGDGRRDGDGDGAPGTGTAAVDAQVAGVRPPTELSGGGPSSSHALPSRGPPVAAADADSHSGRSSGNRNSSSPPPASATHGDGDGTKGTATASVDGQGAPSLHKPEQSCVPWGEAKRSQDWVRDRRGMPAGGFLPERPGDLRDFVRLHLPLLDPGLVVAECATLGAVSGCGRPPPGCGTWAWLLAPAVWRVWADSPSLVQPDGDAPPPIEARLPMLCCVNRACARFGQVRFEAFETHVWRQSENLWPEEICEYFQAAMLPDGEYREKLKELASIVSASLLRTQERRDDKAVSSRLVAIEVFRLVAVQMVELQRCSFNLDWSPSGAGDADPHPFYASVDAVLARQPVPNLPVGTVSRNVAYDLSPSVAGESIDPNHDIGSQPPHKAFHAPGITGCLAEESGAIHSAMDRCVEEGWSEAQSVKGGDRFELTYGLQTGGGTGRQGWMLITQFKSGERKQHHGQLPTSAFRLLASILKLYCGVYDPMRAQRMRGRSQIHFAHFLGRKPQTEAMLRPSDPHGSRLIAMAVRVNRLAVLLDEPCHRAALHLVPFRIERTVWPRSVIYPRSHPEDPYIHTFFRRRLERPARLPKPGLLGSLPERFEVGLADHTTASGVHLVKLLAKDAVSGKLHSDWRNDGVRVPGVYELPRLEDLRTLHTGARGMAGGQLFSALREGKKPLDEISPIKVSASAPADALHFIAAASVPHAATIPGGHPPPRETDVAMAGDGDAAGASTRAPCSTSSSAGGGLATPRSSAGGLSAARSAGDSPTIAAGGSSQCAAAGGTSSGTTNGSSSSEDAGSMVAFNSRVAKLMPYRLEQVKHSMYATELQRTLLEVCGAVPSANLSLGVSVKHLLNAESWLSPARAKEAATWFAKKENEGGKRSKAVEDSDGDADGESRMVSAGAGSDDDGIESDASGGESSDGGPGGPRRGARASLYRRG